MTTLKEKVRIDLEKGELLKYLNYMELYNRDYPVIQEIFEKRPDLKNKLSGVYNIIKEELHLYHQN